MGAPSRLLTRSVASPLRVDSILWARSVGCTWHRVVPLEPAALGDTIPADVGQPSRDADLSRGAVLGHVLHWARALPSHGVLVGSGLSRSAKTRDLSCNALGSVESVASALPATQRHALPATQRRVHPQDSAAYPWHAPKAIASPAWKTDYALECIPGAMTQSGSCGCASSKACGGSPARRPQDRLLQLWPPSALGMGSQMKDALGVFFGPTHARSLQS